MADIKIAEAGPIHEVVEAAIALDLGNPGFLISEKEQGIKDAAIRLGLMDYYRYYPYRITIDKTYTIDNGAPMEISVAQILTAGRPQIPTEQQSNFYFLGLMRAHKPSVNTWSNPMNWNNQLLSASTGYYVSGTTSSSNYNYLTRIALETAEHLSTGNGPRCDYDRVNGVVHIVPNFGIGQYIFDFGFGSTNMEYIEPSKVNFLCEFISYRLIESIVQARSGIKVDADFDISTQALENRLQYLREKTDQIKHLSLSHLAQWG